MDFKRSLFTGDQVCLGPIDYEQDPSIESRWTHDAAYSRLLSTNPARPASPEQVKKRYQAIEKRVEGEKLFFYFAIRQRVDDRLLGFIQIDHVDWTHGTALLQLGIGDPQDGERGYDRQALTLALRFVFDELNLYRISAKVPAYNQSARRLFESFGFAEEVCQREAIQRDGRRWDLLYLGLLQDEWRQNGGDQRERVPEHDDDTQ